MVRRRGKERKGEVEPSQVRKKAGDFVLEELYMIDR